MNSAIVVTAPLTERAWDAIGWEGAELLGDDAHAYCYAQRTADGRIAMGGRGIPYRFGSRTDVDGAHPGLDGRVAARDPAPPVPVARRRADRPRLVRRARRAARLVRQVRVRPATGLGWAGGYVGSGLTTTNLAGRTLRDLVLGRDTDLTRLPWTGHRVRRWEPEPFRWPGVHALYGLYRAADRREDDGLGRTSRLARIAHRVAGR